MTCAGRRRTGEGGPARHVGSGYHSGGGFLLFQLGQTFWSQNYRYSVVGGSVSHYDSIESTLTLTSISDAAAVPEPGTMLLLGGGLLGLIRVKRRG